MQPINMIMIYYWDTRSGGHLEYVLQKMHPLSKRDQINVFINCNYVSFQDMQSFLFFSFLSQ